MREQQLGEVMVEVKDNLEEVAGLVVAAGGATALAPRRLGRMRLGLAVSERTKAKRWGVSEETAAITGAKPRRQAATADAAGGSRSSRRRQVYRQVKGKSFTPLNAARGPRAAHPVAALGRPIFCVFWPFSFVFHFFVSVFSSFMFPFSAIIYIIIFLI
jgi:hypothetical protein